MISQHVGNGNEVNLLSRNTTAEHGIMGQNQTQLERDTSNSRRNNSVSTLKQEDDERKSPLCNTGRKLEEYRDKANVHTSFFCMNLYHKSTGLRCLIQLIPATKCKRVRTDLEQARSSTNIT